MVIARLAAPFPYGGIDYNQTIAESLSVAAKERSDSGDLYVKVDGADPSADILTDLNSRKLPATFAPWSLRHGGSVKGTDPRDNFLSADLLSMPLWHVALVRVKSRTCSAELALVNATPMACRIATNCLQLTSRSTCWDGRSSSFTEAG